MDLRTPIVRRLIDRNLELHNSVGVTQGGIRSVYELLGRSWCLNLSHGSADNACIVSVVLDEISRGSAWLIGCVIWEYLLVFASI